MNFFLLLVVVFAIAAVAKSADTCAAGCGTSNAVKKEMLVERLL
jgi:hypothetical protein